MKALLALPILFCMACLGGPLQVFVSIEPQLESVQAIGGDAVQVHALVPAGASPESFVPGPRVMAALGRAKLYVSIGAPFEGAVLAKVRKMFPELNIVDGTKGMASRHLDEAEMAAHAHCGHHHGHGETCGHVEHHGHGETCGHEEHHGHEEHGDMDPHRWLSIGNMLVHADHVASALKGMLPSEEAAGIERRCVEYKNHLVELDREIAASLKMLENRNIVVFHPAFGYYLDRYGLKQRPVELGGKEPTGRHLCHLIRDACEDGIRVIYVQPQFNSQTASVLAQAIGGRVLPLDPLPRHYSEGMRRMCRQLMQR